jgi:hypothetical protein
VRSRIYTWLPQMLGDGWRVSPTVRYSLGQIIPGAIECTKSDEHQDNADGEAGSGTPESHCDPANHAANDGAERQEHKGK